MKSSCREHSELRQLSWFSWEIPPELRIYKEVLKAGRKCENFPIINFFFFLNEKNSNIFKIIFSNEKFASLQSLDKELFEI